MSSHEMGIEQARPVLGPIADRARYAGRVTYLTRNGSRIAAVVPLNRIREPAMPNTVTLYETNSDVLVIARGDQAWSLGAPSGGYLLGTFAKDALGWVAGDWAPCEAGGQTPTTTDGLKPVAEWGADGVELLVYLEGLGAAARTYLGKSLPVGETLAFNREELDLILEGMNYADYWLADKRKAAPNVDGKNAYSQKIRLMERIGYRLNLYYDGEVTPPGVTGEH